MINKDPKDTGHCVDIDTDVQLAKAGGTANVEYNSRSGTIL